MRLLSTHGADVIIMGCAGMSRFKQPLEQVLGVPVIDPTYAATTMAIGLLRATPG
jgi:Asp/Glu/hydantoin racemase